MKKQNVLTPIILAALTGGATAGVSDPVVPAESSESTSILDSIHLFGTARLRYEYADFNKSGVKESNLLSLRARLGVKTDEIYGFQFLAEGEATGILSDKNKYGPFPPPNNNGRAVIADPDSVLLNRLQLSYNAKALDTLVTVGRQYITLDDQRFIGAVGWRQNDQTFDAAVLQNKSIENLTFTYAYVDQVNRIFGSDAPNNDLEYWEGENHLIHLHYQACDNLAFSGFAYLLDFDTALSNSSDTYGVEMQGHTDIFSGSQLNYLVTAAIQNDAGDNPVNYEEYYFRGQIKVSNDCYHYGLGGECMTSDGDGGRFLFPLGTNHKFNGFADAFLTTPEDGLIDYYTWVGTKAFGFNHTLAVHYFTTQNDSAELGWEVDYVASRPIGEYTKVLVKGAFLDGRGDQHDIARASAEVNVTF